MEHSRAERQVTLPGLNTYELNLWKLYDLLVAALYGALALREVNDVAVSVGNDLDLYVPRLVHELLYEDAVVAERRGRLIPTPPPNMSKET